MTKEQAALEAMDNYLASGTLEELAQKTGYKKEKLFQWKRNQKFPATKIAKAILRAL